MVRHLNIFITSLIAFLLCFVVIFSKSATAAQTRQVALADVTGPGTEYLRELDTVATGNVTYGKEAELLEVQYHEVTKQAGVLTKAAIALASGGNAWLSFGLNTVADAAISGKIDLKNVVKDATFTYVTAGFDTLNPEGFQGVTGELTQNLQLSPVGLGGSDYFSPQWLATSAVDAGVTGAAQTTFYGGNLGDNIAGSFANSVVNESTAALFNEIGNVKQAHNLADGSLPGVIMKGAAGCLSFEASGGSCVSGFIVSASNELASPFYSDGYVEDPNATAQEKERARKTYELDRAYNLGVVTGALTSGGDVSNIGRGSGITTSAIQNNRQLHVKEAELIELYADEYAVERGYCATETSCTDNALIRAKSELAEETLRGVSDDFARVEENAQARGFLNSLNIAGDMVDGQTMFGELDENSDEYRNSLINIGNVVNTPDIYNNLASVQNFAGESGQTYVFDRAGQEQHRYFQDAGRAETLAYFDGIEKTLTNLSGEREELRKKILSAVAKDEDPSALLDQDVTLALHMQGLMDSGTAAVFYASRAGTLTNDELSGNGFIAELRYGSLASMDFSSSGAFATSVRGTAKWFGKKATKRIVANADDLADIRIRYNLSSRDTVAAARTDISELQGQTFEGLSPALRREGGLQPLDEIYGVNRPIKSPNPNPIASRHAEEDILNGLARQIDNAGLSAAQLEGRTVNVHISNAGGVCNVCYQGLGSSTATPGVVRQFSERYPGLNINITAEGGTVRPGVNSITVRGGQIID